MACPGHPGRERGDDRQGGGRADAHAQDQGLARGGAARGAQVSHPTGQPRRSAGIVPVADAGRARGVRGTGPERACIHGSTRRSGGGRGPSCLRPRHEAVDQTLGRTRRRSGSRQDSRFTAPPSDRHPARRRRAALHLFSLLRGLSGSHRAQPQGPHLRHDPDPPAEAGRDEQEARVSRDQSADARAGVKARFRRGAHSIACHHRISR